LGFRKSFYFWRKDWRSSRCCRSGILPNEYTFLEKCCDGWNLEKAKIRPIPSHQRISDGESR